MPTFDDAVEAISQVPYFHARNLGRNAGGNGMECSIIQGEDGDSQIRFTWGEAHTATICDRQFWNNVKKIREYLRTEDNSKVNVVINYKKAEYTRRIAFDEPFRNDSKAKYVAGIMREIEELQA